MYHVVVVSTVSKYKTKKDALAALKLLSKKHGDIAMVVKMPDKKEKSK